MSAVFKADLEVCFLSVQLLDFDCILPNLSFCSLMEALETRCPAPQSLFICGAQVVYSLQHPHPYIRCTG